jgi:UDP-N-acetylglucosamine 2-epimerase (non-hydrolysing)
LKKILIVFGTRPEAIKMAPVIRCAEKKFNVKVCVTAQHREMLDEVLHLFEITPSYDLNVMKAEQDLFDITHLVLFGIKDVLLKERPDIVLVHGDTTTAMVASLASFYLKIPVAHVEAGLRTYDIFSPFPEELNRNIVTKISSIHFSPTETARENLIRECIPNNQIYVTGNTVIDALLSMVKKSRKSSYSKDLLFQLPFLDANQNEKSRIILVTGHRRENFGHGFKEICYALCNIARYHPDVKIVYPVHLNPNVRAPVNLMLSKISNIYLIDPLDYMSFIKLLDASYIVLTDSGGIQEEAPSLGKPVLVMRDKTERPEAVKVGTVKLVGTDQIKIFKEVHNLLTNSSAYENMSILHNPYGDGMASDRICEILEEVI